MPRKFNLFLVSALLVAAANTTPLGSVYAQENTYGPVKSGELIWNIAGKVSPNASVSRQQVIMGILRANPSAFKVPCNFNSLKVGEKLVVPTLADIQAVSQEEAQKEFEGQNEAWKNRKKNPIVCPAPEVATAAEEATPTSPPAATAAEVAPPKEVSPAAVSNDASTGAQASPPVTPPPSTPPVAPPPVAPPPVASPPVEAPTAVVPPPSEAPKQVADNVAPSPPTVSSSAVAPVVTPASTESAPPPSLLSNPPPKTPSQLPDLIIWILIGGGVLSAFIIAGLLHAHARQEASANPNKYNFAEDKKPASDDADDMPLYDDDRDENKSADVVKD